MKISEEIYPKCKLKDCRANEKGECIALSDNNFKDRERCPFYRSIHEKAYIRYRREKA